MKVFAVSQKGINKSENEDRVIVGKSVIAEGVFIGDISQGTIAVADGVGGNNAGAVASHFVAAKLTCLDELTYDRIAAVNDELLKLSDESAQNEGMATTLSGVQVYSKGVRVFNIGNSRVYLLQSKKYLKQLTKDDTTLNYLLETGQITSEDAENFDRKNEITTCMGGGKRNIFKAQITNMDPFNLPIMIATDGLHDYVSIDKMEDIIEKYGISIAACQALLCEARNSGSEDDVSVVLGDL